jgi:hypothetical protein
MVLSWRCLPAVGSGVLGRKAGFVVLALGWWRWAWLG